jgi:hypothetical protein
MAKHSNTIIIHGDIVKIGYTETYIEDLHSTAMVEKT